MAKKTTTFLMSSKALRTEAGRRLSAAGYTTEEDELLPGEKGASLKVRHDDQDTTRVREMLHAIDPNLKTRHDT